MVENAKSNLRIYKMTFGSVYPLYVQKAERKGRNQHEVDAIVSWLTGYNAQEVRKHIENGSTFETFFAEAHLHPNASKITGVMCGYRVELLEDKLVQKVRYLDKLIDELAQGKSLEKILRT